MMEVVVTAGAVMCKAPVIVTINKSTPEVRNMMLKGFCFVCCAGITNFDLLGNYGRLEWLGNFQLVLSYNLVFAIATVICLTTKFTASVRTALIDGLLQSAKHAVRKIHRSHSHHPPPFTRLKDD